MQCAARCCEYHQQRDAQTIHEGFIKSRWGISSLRQAKRSDFLARCAWHCILGSCCAFTAYTIKYVASHRLLNGVHECPAQSKDAFCTLHYCVMSVAASQVRRVPYDPCWRLSLEVFDCSGVMRRQRPNICPHSLQSASVVVLGSVCLFSCSAPSKTQHRHIPCNLHRRLFLEVIIDPLFCAVRDATSAYILHTIPIGGCP